MGTIIEDALINLGIYEQKVPIILESVPQIVRNYEHNYSIVELKKMFETLVYIHIAQNIREEGMWIKEKNCPNKDFLEKLSLLNLIDPTHWNRLSVRTTPEGEKLSEAIMDAKIENAEVIKILETAPPIMIRIIQNNHPLLTVFSNNSYVQSHGDFPKDFIISLPYYNETVYKLCSNFYINAIKAGWGDLAHYYVSTDGGKEKEEYYILSDEIMNFIEEYNTESIPKEFKKQINEINEIKDRLYALNFLFHYNDASFNGIGNYSLVEQIILEYLKYLSDLIDMSKDLFISGFTNQMPFMIRETDAYNSRIVTFEKELNKQLTDLFTGLDTQILKTTATKLDKDEPKTSEPQQEMPEPPTPPLQPTKEPRIPTSEIKQKLLECFSPTNIQEDVTEDYLIRLEKKIKPILCDFKIKCEVKWQEFDIGPRLIRSNILLDKGVKISQVTSISEDIANKLFSDKELFTFEKDDEVPKDLFIESVPSKGAVGIYIPRYKFLLFGVREILEEFPPDNTLNFSIGKNIVGENQYSNLEEMPHLLVAGHTGAGKSVFLNSLIVGLIYQNSPKDLQFIMIDPKGGLEFAIYDEIPFLSKKIVDNCDQYIFS